MKAGLEIHQQLDCGKLFCTCDSLDIGNDSVFVRKLHATSSEMGSIDVAAKAEGVRVEIAAVKQNTARILIDESDHYHEIISDDLFIYKGSKRSSYTKKK